MSEHFSAPEAPGLFVRDGADRFVPTEFGQSPWAKDLLFGGTPAALLATVLDDVPSLGPLQLTRLTVDLLRPVPMRPCVVTTHIRREGKKIQVLDASITVDGIEVVRASALRLRQVDPAGFEGMALPAGAPRPEVLRPPVTTALVMAEDQRRNGFVPGIRYASDIAFDPDLAWSSPRIWWRLHTPVIAGEELKPLARACFVADGASGVGHPHNARVTGINADISIHIVRPPVSEWLCIEGTGWTSRNGIGHSNVTLSDDDGVAATVVLSRLVDPL